MQSYGSRLSPGKCLWKWMFVGHSHPRLNVALWVLCNLEHPSCTVSGRAGRIQNQGAVMTEQSVRLGPREQQIVELLLQGCDNAEIASQLKMTRRTVKAHFTRLFLRLQINTAIKRA